MIKAVSLNKQIPEHLAKGYGDLLVHFNQIEAVDPTIDMAVSKLDNSRYDLIKRISQFTDPATGLIDNQTVKIDFVN